MIKPKDYNEFMENLEELLYSDKEPEVGFNTEDGTRVLTVCSSGMVYNRDEFPHDTAEKAAKRFYALIKPISEAFPMPEMKWSLSEWKSNPKREFSIKESVGVTHNYDLDTWHYWFVEYLNRLVKGRRPS